MFVTRWKRAVERLAARLAKASVAAGMVAAVAMPTLAQAQGGPDWYIFVGRNAAENPIIVYFQSDSASPEFEPIASVALVLDPSYTPEGQFDPSKGCLATSLEFDPADAKALRTQIIYGPNSAQRNVSVIDFPSYMARSTALALLQEGVLIDESATVPYFNCAGFIWANLISQPPEVWQDILKQAIEDKRAEQQ